MGQNAATNQAQLQQSLAGYGNDAGVNRGMALSGGTLGAAKAKISGFLGAANAYAGGQQNASALNMYGQGQMNQGFTSAAGAGASFLNSDFFE